MNGPVPADVWTGPLAVLAAGTAGLVLLSAGAARLARLASWRRTIWQAGLLGVAILAAGELTGLGRAIGPWLAEAMQARAAATPRTDDSFLDRPGEAIQEFTVPGEAGGPAPAIGLLAAAAADPAAENERAAAGLAAAATGPNWTVRLGWWPAIAWLVGALLVLARAMTARGLMAAFRRRHRPVDDAGLCRLAAALAQRLGLRRDAAIVEAAGLSGPIAFGVLRPTIALPQGFVERLDADSRRAVLAHELAHLAGGDAAWRLLADLVTVALWWHPLAWWARRQLSVACESAADEATLAVAAGPRRLAACLVALGRRFAPSRAGAWAAARGSGFRSSLGRRVEHLLRLGSRPRRRPGRGATVLARTVAPVVLVVGALLGTAWARPRGPAAGGALAALQAGWRQSLARAALHAVERLVPDVPAERREPMRGRAGWAFLPFTEPGPTTRPAAEEGKGPADSLRSEAERLHRLARTHKAQAREMAAQGEDLRAQGAGAAGQAARLRRAAAAARARAEETADAKRREQLLALAKQYDRGAADAQRLAEDSLRGADTSERSAFEEARRAEELEARAAELERRARAAEAASRPPGTGGEGDRSPGSPPTRIQLRRVKAQVVAELLAGLSGCLEGDRAAGGGPVRVVPVERTNSVLISAPPRMLAGIRRLVAKLEAAAPDAIQTRTYKLKRLSAKDAVTALERVLTSGGKPLFGQGQLKLVPDARANAVIVAGSPKAVEVAGALLATLDGLPGGPTTAPASGESTYVRDLRAFFREIDERYPFVKLKGIEKDWQQAKERLAAKVKGCKSDTEFLGIVIEAVRCLRDGHLWLRPREAKLPRPPAPYYPGIAFLPATKSRVIVMYPPRGHEQAMKAGTIVTEIDGQDARRALEERAKKAWASGGSFSSPQRARLFEYRIPLRGEKGRKHKITYLSGGEKKTVELTCSVEARGWPHRYNPPAGLVRVGRSFFYTQLAGGAGYLWIRRVDGSAEPGIRAALAKHPKAQGWIVDLRGNGGGGYSSGLIDAMKSIPRPVAVLMDAGCFSAGETVARDLARYAGARLFGSKTAGSSGAKRQWTFPSGIATFTLPYRSHRRRDRRPIEFNGIDPDEKVEAVPEEVARGQNSAILRAEEYLKKQ